MNAPAGDGTRPPGPEGTGSFEDAERLRRWSFLQRSPSQRLDWLIEMLEIAYASGALQPRRPERAADTEVPPGAE